LNDYDSKDWRQLYQAALLEPDVSKLPERIELASSAVKAKLQGLTGAGDSFEREILMDALRTLRTLRQERP
jgi:hypothetical protein